MKKKVIHEGEYEDVIEIENHYYLVNKKDRICILPYTISGSNLLDKLGVVEDFNYVEEEKVLTLINDYLNVDDQTDLVAANRILYEIIGSNVPNANNWLYLGTLFNTLSSDSLIKVYAVDISNVEIKNDEGVEDEKERKKFKLLDSSRVVQTDDSLMLSSYFRLFQHFYINSLNSNKKIE